MDFGLAALPPIIGQGGFGARRGDDKGVAPQSSTGAAVRRVDGEENSSIGNGNSKFRSPIFDRISRKGDRDDGEDDDTDEESGETTKRSSLELGFLFSGVGSPPYSAPEVYYQRELHGGAGYSGERADGWSIAVILFVMLTGRPPFVRPLAATYSKSLRRCKHFCRLLKGQGFGNISEQAKGVFCPLCPRFLFVSTPCVS